MPLFLMFVAMLAYMVALLVFMFGDLYEGPNSTPMAQYLRVYGVMDLLFFVFLTLLRGVTLYEEHPISFPGYIILVWSSDPVQAVLWFAHLAYLVVVCVFIFAEVGVAGGSTGTQVYKWILGLFPPVAIVIGGAFSSRKVLPARNEDSSDRVVRLL
jgi:hypothetical protein